MAEIEGLVRALREGDDAKTAVARALGDLAYANGANRVLIAEAGGIPPLVELLRDGSADAKACAAMALNYLAYNYEASRVLIAEAGAIPLLVDLLRDGSADAKWAAAHALRNLACDNDANAVSIAMAVSLEAVVELARRGSVTVENKLIVCDADHATLPAKRKAALVVAALLRGRVPVDARSRADVRDVIRAVIGPYL